MPPSYLSLSRQDWTNRSKAASKLLDSCVVCPRECQVDRNSLEASLGFCQMRSKPVIAGADSHFGEEGPLVGQYGSGTIFFSSCNLACVYCQNFDISHQNKGEPVSVDSLADIMLQLQNKKCHNINLVTPSIWVPQIIQALEKAVNQGLNIPIVYNTGGYDRPETLKLLRGIVDIYMPDIKYADNQAAKKYSDVLNYWDVVQKAVKEMHQQVGDLQLNRKGVAQRGLLIRHLVLPNNIANSQEIMRFLADKISKDTYINIMDQYYPTYQARQHSKLSRELTSDEFEKVVTAAKLAGLHRFDHLP